MNGLLALIFITQNDEIKMQYKKKCSKLAENNTSRKMQYENPKVTFSKFVAAGSIQ